MKVLLENLLRNEDGRSVTKEAISAVAAWLVDRGTAGVEIAYRPARELLQDFTDVPAVVDLAAVRDPGLRAIDHILVAATHCAGGQCRRVRPGMALRQGVGAQ